MMTPMLPPWQCSCPEQGLRVRCRESPESEAVTEEVATVTPAPDGVWI